MKKTIFFLPDKQSRAVQESRKSYGYTPLTCLLPHSPRLQLTEDEVSFLEHFCKKVIAYLLI